MESDSGRTPIVTVDDIRQAQQRLRGVAARTPLIAYEEDGRRLWFKPESFQPIGSFKLRGAYNKIASLPEDERRRGVIHVDISGKVRALIATAQRQGWAVAAAHITTGTPQVVARMLPAFRAAGIEFVPITEFLKGGTP